MRHGLAIDVFIKEYITQYVYYIAYSVIKVPRGWWPIEYTDDTTLNRLCRTSRVSMYVRCFILFFFFKYLYIAVYALYSVHVGRFLQRSMTFGDFFFLLHHWIVSIYPVYFYYFSWFLKLEQWECCLKNSINMVL